MNPYALRLLLPTPLRPFAKAFHHRVTGWYDGLITTLHGPHISPREMERFLGRIGFQPGATLLLHSSLDALQTCAPEIPPLTLIRMMQSLLGEQGTLLMPTFPFRGRQIQYAAQGKVFDPRRTPSRVGMLTEIFRRLPEVQRSLHPTHPVCGWGARAGTLLADHHRGGTFAVTSPFHRLAEQNGRVVGLGVGIETFTILYVPEETDPVLRQRFFAAEPVPMVMEVEGVRQTYALTPRTGLTDYPNLNLFADRLLEEGVLRYHRCKGLKCAEILASEAIGRYRDLIAEGLLLSMDAPADPPSGANTGLLPEPH